VTVLEQRVAYGKAVHVRQRHIQKDELGRKRLREPERGRLVARLSDDFESLRFEERTDERPEAGVVVDNQNGRRHEQIVAWRATPRIRGSPVLR
jgi:hypothetical protein